jgi:hypothetical protein
LSRDAFVAGVLNRAGGIATVIVESVAVVANLACADDIVAAYNQTMAGPRRRTLPMGLDLANTVAAIAGQHVAVVAFLGRLVDPVAAGRRYLGLAAQCALGVAHIGRTTGGRATVSEGRDDGRTTVSVRSAVALGTSTWPGTCPSTFNR